MNKTFLKFGYPDSLLKNYKYWGILLRPQQTTLGSLVIVCKENVSSFSEVSNMALTRIFLFTPSPLMKYTIFGQKVIFMLDLL